MRATGRLAGQWSLGYFQGTVNWRMGLLAAGLWLGMAVFQMGRAWASDFEIREEGWNGCSDLWRLAESELSPSQVHVVPGIDYSVLRPDDGLLFLHPLEAIHFQSLAAFLSSGGRAAVVDDFGQGELLLAKFHIRRGEAPVNPRWLAEGRSSLPIAMPVPEQAAGKNSHPMLKGVETVVTNHPSTLIPDPDIELTPLLAIELQGGAAQLLAATGVIGDVDSCGLSADRAPSGTCGRLVAVADPSIFINLMLRYAGNEQFAVGLVKYLLAPDNWGKRGGNLYILSGEFSQKGSYTGESSFADELEERWQRLIRWVGSLRDEGLAPAAVGALALLVGISLSLWAAYIAGQSKQAVGSRFSVSIPLRDQGGFAGRYAALAFTSNDRAMLLLELQRTLEANLRMRLGLEREASRDEIRKTASRLGLLNFQKDLALSKLFAQLAAGEAAILSGRKLRISDGRLAAIASEIVATVAAMTPANSSSELQFAKVPHGA